jgi:hypothetical protein
MKRFFGLMILLATAAGCGGGSTATGLRVTPEEARPSDRVTLSGAGLEVDDTVCFVPLDESGDDVSKGCAHPAMPEISTVNEKEFQATVQVPTGLRPGAYVIKVARGADIGDGVDFTVLSFEKSSEKSSKPVENVTTPAGGDGETILPSGGSGNDPSVPEDDAGSGGTLPPPPAPVALSASLEGTMAVTDAKTGTIRIEYKTTGTLKNLYVYGPFTPDTDCDDRLAIDPTGNDLLAGSPNEIKYRAFTSGEVCDPMAGNCLNFEPSAGSGTYCRIPLASPSGSFFVRQYQKDSDYTLVAEGMDDTVKTASKSLSAPEPHAIPDVSLTSDEKALRVRFNFTNAASHPSLTGCVPVGAPQFTSNANGSGSYEQVCALKRDQTITMTVPGLAYQKAEQTVRASLGVVAVSVTKGDIHCDTTQTVLLNDQCPGTEKHFWKATRPLTLTNQTTGASTTIETKAIKSMELYVENGATGVLEKKDSKDGGQGSFEVVRDHLHTYLQFRAIDWDGANVNTFHTWATPFPAALSLVEAKTLATRMDYSDECDSYNPADWGGFCETCDEIDSGKLDVSIRWNARHIKKIRSTDCAFETVKPDAGVYEAQDVTLRGTIDFGTNMQRSLTCTFEAIPYTGPKITFRQAWDGGCNIVTGGM